VGTHIPTHSSSPGHASCLPSFKCARLFVCLFGWLVGLFIHPSIIGSSLTKYCINDFTTSAFAWTCLVLPNQQSVQLKTCPSMHGSTISNSWAPPPHRNTCCCKKPMKLIDKTLNPHWYHHGGTPKIHQICF